MGTRCLRHATLLLLRQKGEDRHIEENVMLGWMFSSVTHKDALGRVMCPVPVSSRYNFMIPFKEAMYRLKAWWVGR